MEQKDKRERQAVVFAFYKDDKLIGYRQDTLGTIGDQPKIYNSSRSQIETVLRNITNNIIKLPQLGSFLGVKAIEDAENKIHEMLQDEKAFEVRVVESPDYEVDDEGHVILGSYPFGAIEEWKQYPETHKVLETHYFSINGLINQQ